MTMTEAVERYLAGKRQLEAACKVEQPDTLDQEKLALIRELRDTTQSRSTYARCVAIVGERGA